MEKFDPPMVRFLRSVDKQPEGCWVWTGTNSGHKKPYGNIRVHNSEGSPVRVKAHRWAYEQFVGPIPEGLTIDHLCRNTLCVNPEHLEPVTHAENCRRRPLQTGPRPHLNGLCQRGLHSLLDPDNVRWKYGKRAGCLACYTEARKSKRKQQPKP
jgi:hypothetical protein